MHNVLSGNFQRAILIFIAFSIFKSIFEMWDYPLESVRKSCFQNWKKVCYFNLEHGHMWILHDSERLTRNLIQCQGIWEAVEDDTWPFVASQGIEVKTSPGGLQNHLTFLISDGPSKKKPEKIGVTKKFQFTNLLIYLFKVSLTLQLVYLNAYLYSSQQPS